MKSIMAGPDGTAMPGQIATIDAQRGMILVAGGYADIVELEPQVETAMIEPEETTSIRPVKAKSRGKKP